MDQISRVKRALELSRVRGYVVTTNSGRFSCIIRFSPDGHVIPGAKGKIYLPASPSLMTITHMAAVIKDQA